MKSKNFSRFLAFCTFALILAVLFIFLIGPVSLSFVQWLAIFGGTFGVARIIARETVCEPIREASYKVGIEELVTCPRCVGVWVTLVLLIGMIYLPAQTMIVCGIFAVSGANILLQEIMGLMVRATDFLDMKNLPYTQSADYGGESHVGKVRLYDESQEEEA